MIQLGWLPKVLSFNRHIELQPQFIRPKPKLKMNEKKMKTSTNTGGLLDYLPPGIVKECIIQFLDEIDTLCLLRTCKQMGIIIGKSVDVNGQYQRLKVCCICKGKHDVAYRDRLSKLYAHPKCINRKYAYWTYFNAGRPNGLVYRNKTQRYEINPQKPSVQIYGSEFMDVVNNYNSMTVSSIYRRLAPRNHHILEYERTEDVMLRQHIWFLNNKNMIFNADRYFRQKEWHKLRITKGKRLDVYDLYKYTLLAKETSTKPIFPTTLQELVIDVNSLCLDCSSFIDKMRIWYDNLKRRHGYNWFHEAHTILDNGTIEQTRTYVFNYVHSPGDLIIDLMNKELAIF